MGGSFETESCCSGKSGKDGVADKIFEEGKVVKEEVEVVEKLGYRVGAGRGKGWAGF